ncbi:MAG: ribose-phosphate diphosphokinase [Candidatus Dependentiae bacterium]
MKQIIIASEHQVQLAEQIAQKMNVPLIMSKTVRFADSEMRIDFVVDNDLILEAHAIVVHSTGRPVHDNLMWLLLTCYQLKQKGVKTITAVIPYFGYGRQDKNSDGTVGAVQMIARMLEVAGIDQIVTVELHVPEVIKYFSIPVHNIKLDNFIAHFLKHYCIKKDCTFIAPDKGADDRVVAIANQLDAPVMHFAKERYAVNQTRIISSQGTCKTDKSIIIDDIIDTGSTIVHVAQELYQKNRSCNIAAFAVHPVLSANASDYLQQSVLSKVWVTNSIQLAIDQQFKKLEVVDISDEIVACLDNISIQ